MKNTKNSAKENLTVDQALELFRNFVNDRIDKERTGVFKLAAKAGILEALIEILIIKDPVDVLDKLHIARSFFEVVEYENADDITGKLYGIYHTESMANEIAQNLKVLSPKKLYLVTNKIHVL
jgi:hypothetical protein